MVCKSFLNNGLDRKFPGFPVPFGVTPKIETAEGIPPNTRVCYRPPATARICPFAESGFCGKTYPRLREMMAAALFAALAKWGTFSRVTRVVGPETLSEAATLPDELKIGVPIHRDPNTLLRCRWSSRAAGSRQALSQLRDPTSACAV